MQYPDIQVKWPLQNEGFAAAPISAIVRLRKPRACGKASAKTLGFCMAKSVLASKPAPNIEIGFKYCILMLQVMG